MKIVSPTLNAEYCRHLRRSSAVCILVIAISGLFGLGPKTCFAQAEIQGSTYTFDAAQKRLTEVSDALHGARAAVEATRSKARSLQSLNFPEINIEAREMDIKKTYDLSDLDFSLSPSLVSVFQNLHIPPSALALPESIELVNGWRFRPEVSFTWPIYTGGKISATQQAAEYVQGQSEAELMITDENITVQLVRVYFGQELSRRVLDIQTEVRDGLELHYQNAVKMQKQGFISRSQLLQAQVARDEAERNYQKALSGYATTSSVLAKMLHHEGPVDTSTPLFMVVGPIGDAKQYTESALVLNPQIKRLNAIIDQAQQSVQIEKSKCMPTVFLFGLYDLYHEDALLTDPNWAYGIGVRYTLFSNIDRSLSISTAHEREIQASAGLRQTRVDLETSITSIYNELRTAQTQYVLLKTNILQAQENLRLQELSFREGQATSVDVVDARLALGRAKTERAQAAYQFDVTLAQLLSLSGQSFRFGEYVKTADEVIQ